MKNLYHPILKTIAEDYSPDDPESPLRRCDYFSWWFVCWDINKRKALWFVYPPETIADELKEYLVVNSKIFDRNEVVKIIEKYI